MAVIFNAFGIRADSTFGTFGAFIENAETKQVYWSLPMGDHDWSGAQPLPERYMTKADARSRAEAHNIRVTGCRASSSRVLSASRIEWKQTHNGRENGCWTLAQLIELGKLTVKQGAAIRAFYNVDAS
jgi:hypothetical protein